MKMTPLILCLGLTAPVLLAQTSEPQATSVSDRASEPARPPYVVRLQKLDEASAAPLSAALAKLPGVDEVEAFPGDKRAVHLHTLAGHYVARAQVADVVRRERLELDALEIPQWAKMRFYVVEASGGG